jgi:hypothetical protein
MTFIKSVFKVCNNLIKCSKEACTKFVRSLLDIHKKFVQSFKKFLRMSLGIYKNGIRSLKECHKKFMRMS